MDPASADHVRPPLGAEHWSQRVSGLAALPRLLAEQGVAPAGVLKAAGLAPNALSRADQRISFTGAVRALSEATRSSGCAHFGLRVGAQTRLADLGSVGALMQGAPTVGAALRVFADHHRRISTGGAVFLHEHGRSVSLGYAVFHPDVARVGPVYDVAAGAGARLMRELCGEEWTPAELLLPHRRPPDARPFEALFRCPIRFDAEHLAMRFPAALMDRSLHHRPGHAVLAPAGGQAPSGEDDLLPQLYRSLRLQLLQGVVHGRDNARALDMSRRTLGRRLEALGLGFRQVLDDVRFALARSLLGETDLPVVDIALTLGYAEASPFVRAFRRWSGMSPLQWRGLQRAADANDCPPAPAEPGCRRAGACQVSEAS